MKSLAFTLGVLAVGCGGSGNDQPPTPGVASVKFVALSPTDVELAVKVGDIRLSRIAIGGDSPPPFDAPMPNLDLDLTAVAGGTTTLTDYPPALYSVVLIEFHGVMLSGLWRGVPFALHVEPNKPQVHIHAAVGQALGDNENAQFTVSIDVNSWFEQGPNLLLDGAAAMDGTITVDDQHNPGIAAEIAVNISASFSID